MMGASQQQTPPADDHAATRHAASASGITGAIGIPNRPVILAGIRTGLDSIYPACTPAVALPFNRGCSAIVRLADSPGALVPSGAHRAGGGAVAGREAVLSLAHMNRILGLDTGTQPNLRGGAMAMQAAARAEGLIYPVDFASSGSSQIGGNIATNAGGIQVIRYGMTRNWVTGLKVVTGTGELLELNKGLIKNNTGLDFRHLMIGSEVLGIIVEATLALTAPPRDPRVMVLGAP